MCQRQSEAIKAVPNRWCDWLVALLLVVATVAVYWQVRGHEFLNYDDKIYVSENKNVQAGLTGDNIVWAFARPHIGHWHPLTWLSYMVDVELFGANPSALHTTNLMLHTAGAVLLFFVLRRMTGALWKSAFVAALFALHPLHVEPVAWISSRKDVLSGVFFMLTVLAYARYVDRPGVLRYFLVVLFFALGLMSKPMLVTLPFVLLLLDYWPLGRTGGGLSTVQGSAGAYWKLFREKLPLFALTGMSCVASYYAAKIEGVIGPAEIYPLRLRIPNALVSYVRYISKTLWPRYLAVHYPYPRDTLPLWQAGVALMLLVGVSVLVFRLRRRYPYLGVGWAWYVGTLVPVIGIVQVSDHVMADRYTYVPLIGLFIIVAWGVPDLVARWRYRRVGLAVSAAAVLSAVTVCTWYQLGRWENSVTLFEHALRVTSNNGLAHTNLGHALLEEGRVDEAIDHFSRALTIHPGYVKARTNMGIALAGQGRLDEAVGHLSQALALDPDNVDAHYNMGVAMIKKGNLDVASTHFSEVLRLRPDDADAHFSLGAILMTQGKLPGAAAEFEEVLKLRPDYAKARKYLDQVREAERKRQELN